MFVALMKFYEGVAQLSSRVSSASPFRLCWSSGACRSAVHPAMRGVDLRALTVARNWKESRPREARPEDSSIYIYIYYTYLPPLGDRSGGLLSGLL